MRNKPTMPNMDYILNNETDKLSEAQVLWYNLLRMVDSFYFLLNTQLGLMQSTQAGYNFTTLSKYIDAIALVAEETSCDRKNPFRQDEFTKIAFKAMPVISKIVRTPRTRLTKETCKLHLSQVREISSKTIEWLAEQPQEKIEDKIKPNNTVLTRKVVFSTDTTENRTLRYFYDRLYKYISKLVEDSDCSACEKAGECRIVSDAQGFLRIKNAMRKAELNTVPAQLATMPNNALMCDKYYSVIWREAKNLKEVERRITNLWDRLPQYLLQLELLIKVAEAVGTKGGRILERIVTFRDSVGIVIGDKPVQSVRVLANDKITQYDIFDSKIVISEVSDV